jgi:hypothetical protein
MSAYFSLVAGPAAFLFTDGAGYSNDGILRKVSRKVQTAASAPFAVTAVGNANLGDRIKVFLAEMAERNGVEPFFAEVLPEFLASLRQSYVEAGPNPENDVVVMMAAATPERGAFNVKFQTMPEPGRDDILPFVASRADNFAYRGPTFDVMKMAGIRSIEPGEDRLDFARHVGRQVMEFARAERCVPMHLQGTGAPASHYVGGCIDLTIVDADGARTERIHAWPDRIGERIEPARVPLAA